MFHSIPPGSSGKSSRATCRVIGPFSSSIASARTISYFHWRRGTRELRERLDPGTVLDSFLVDWAKKHADSMMQFFSAQGPPLRTTNACDSGPRMPVNASVARETTAFLRQIMDVVGRAEEHARFVDQVAGLCGFTDLPPAPTEPGHSHGPTTADDVPAGIRIHIVQTVLLDTWMYRFFFPGPENQIDT